MKINKAVVLVLLLVSLFTLAVSSQISQVTDKISIEEARTCDTSFYNEIQDIYGTCINYRNYTSCLNTSGANTDCSLQQTQINFSCKTGEVTLAKNRTDCNPLDKFTISIDKGSIIERKEIDFSEWGACIHNVENNCLIVTCVSRYDGAHNGRFTDCRGGKSCQKFQICDDKVKVYYKNSREDFADEDPSFYLSKLALKEVGR